jgi:hypothetical protein
MHCGMCHTPKNMLGGDELSRRLQGYVLQGWFAPNITNDDRRGLGSWSMEDIVSYLKTGHNQTPAASGPMSEEVSDSSANITDAPARLLSTWRTSQLEAMRTMHQPRSTKRS